MNKMSWKTNSAARPQPWGSEVIWTAMNILHGKLLNIRKGLRTSLKYHNLKDEVLFLLEGKVEVLHGRSKTLNNPSKHPFKKVILEPGECMIIQAGSPYRIEALEESQIIEIGNRSSDTSIRLLDDYGRDLQDGTHDWAKYIREIE
jgi:mannose-6-phosphate isomerase-like protein (cupin superfamily)